MFEITGDEIADLNDADLRTLIGLLCEAEMRRRGLPTSAVTYGGNQDAKDGGLDVRVALPPGTAIEGFVPKPATGFQVKKPDMPKSKILEEMKPNGNLRPVILELAATGGAYVIVSATGSTADFALIDRREGMSTAVKGSPAEGNIELEFYDRNRIATWVRDHPGVILWVRSRIGRSLRGWRPYESWSHMPADVDAGYLADDKARIYTGEKGEGGRISAIEGINRIRRLLASPGRIVRLVGLSGVGKTRLAEALFDASVGEGPLDPSHAFYADEADMPDPSPVGLASDLIAERSRAVLVIDNCTPGLHQKLSSVARTSNSTISIITIEYDIREDQSSEGTDVFLLESSSIPLIQKLVEQRYAHLSQTDAHTVADFSGGNARIALALASNIGKSETIAGLNEEDLFNRLFQQRHETDSSLLKVAQACSLVYSFEGETLEGKGAELPVLGGLIGKSADEVYARVDDLKQRDLVQSRAQWRAVLPHAIANRLAKRALQSIPPSKINSALVTHASERLIRSFSRRLGYLHDSDEARTIVKSWLAPDGLLGDLTTQNALGRQLFTNIAPVDPESTLVALESAIVDADDGTLRRCDSYVRILRSLAYDSTFFERALALLVRFAALSNDNENTEATEVITSLFHIALSGTHAPVDMRIRVAEALLTSDVERIRQLGVKIVEALMKTDHFSSHYEFEFGARSRDYGYFPPTGADARAWFESVLPLAKKFALSDGPISAEMRQAIAREFRGLWHASGCTDGLDVLTRAIAEKSFWRDGWIAIRETLTYDRNTMDSERREQLIALEEFLRPKDLVSKMRGLVTRSSNGVFELDDFEDDEDDSEGDSTKKYEERARRLAAAVRELGHDVAADSEAFRKMLPELMQGNTNIHSFGEALAEAAENPGAMWSAMIEQFAVAESANLGLLSGFIAGLNKRDAKLTEAILDEALDHPALAAWFPNLQTCVPIGVSGYRRLIRALEQGKADIKHYHTLAYGRVSDRLPGLPFKNLVLAILRQPRGVPVALDVVAMRLLSGREKKQRPLPQVIEAGRLVLDAIELVHKDHQDTREDYLLGQVVRASLIGDEGIPVTQALCKKLMVAAEKKPMIGYDYHNLVKGLFDLHPIVVLDELFSGDLDSQKASIRLLNNLFRFHGDVMGGVPDAVLIDWCDRDPAVRYPIAASVVLLFKRPDKDEPHEWTPLTKLLLEKAPEPRRVLSEIVSRLHPPSWSGSLATKLEGRLALLGKLPAADIPELAEAIVEASNILQAQIDAERRREQEEDRQQSNRFE